VLSAHTIFAQLALILRSAYLTNSSGMFSRWFLIALVGLFAASTAGCSVEDDFPKRGTNFILSGIDVQVNHPTEGGLANMVVSLYKDEDKLEQNKADFTVRTLPGGLAKFRDVPFGIWYVACTVPGNPRAYGSKEIYIELNSIGLETLNLVAKP